MRITSLDVVPQNGLGTLFDVAIVGGGASGVLVAIHLLHSSPALRVAVIEPRNKLGQGVAYSTRGPEHLLNVIASRMSAFDSDPNHFVRFLIDAQKGDQDNQDLEIGLRFAQRAEYGRYLHATLQASPRAGDVHWIQDEAVDLTSGDDFALVLKSGVRLRASNVVLAIGNEARAIPLPAVSIQGEPRIESAWDYDAVRSIEPQADVCIIGSGLSMVDAVVSMVERKHRGRITVLSRHGLTPLPHTTPGKQRGHVDDLLALGMRERLHAIRQRARVGERNGEPWQWMMDALRYHGQALWTQSSDSERRRFLRHAARFWDIHRHRIAPQVAEQLEQLRMSGQLIVRPGHLLSIINHGNTTRVLIRPRGTMQNEEIRVSYVINATGIETSLSRMQRPLLKSMQASGLIQPGPQGMGIATDSRGIVINRDGSLHPRVFILGALRIGELWESIAIPELRLQASHIAKHINTKQ